MKNTFRIYILAILLMVTAIFSGKSVVRKMKQSGMAVDTVFFKICSLYQEQDQMVHLLGFQLESAGLIPPGATLEAPHKLFQTSELTFAVFSDYEVFQKTLDQRVMLIDSIILVLSRDKQNDMEPLAQKVNNQADKINKMKKKYNENARGYNSFIKTFPRNIYSIFFHIQTKPYFKEKKE